MIKSFCEKHNILLETGVVLAEKTTFRIGGPADYAVYPETTAQMAELIRFLNENQLRYFVLGRGSDILAADEGYRGIIVMTKAMNTLQCEGHKIFAGAGCSMTSVSNLALKNSLAGLEFLHGIPGSVGGGVFMNAGAYGSEMSGFLESVEWVDMKGEIHVSPVDELALSYRHSRFVDHPGIVCSAVFSCAPGNPEQIKATIADLNARRREKQPLEYPSAGSAFKRPAGHFAGKLIEDSGLKGYSVGDAWVSEKHAGFIVNKGSASCAQVKELISRVIEKVRSDSGITLEPEIRFLDE